MTNIMKNIRVQIVDAVKKAIETAVEKGELPEVSIPGIQIEVPREKGHGDLSTNVAMQITKQVKISPRQTAAVIINNLQLEGTYLEKVECAGPGFINFYLANDGFLKNLEFIRQKGEQYGKSDIGKGQRVMVEFVSANPTGPVHMGNARGGALGDCIASVLKAVGYDVTKEFYINDAGNQIEKFALSLEARYIQELNGEDAVEFPKDGYRGEDIKDHVKNYISEFGDILLSEDSEERKKRLVEYALPKNIDRIRMGLAGYGVTFDVWFSEQSLYKSGEFESTMDMLKEKGYTFEKDGAVWFKASCFGSEKDEVIIRKNGMPTYFASDIGYHRNKFENRKFDRVINLLGADHHGHVSRMKAAVKALGIDENKLDIVIFQLVRLYRNGEIARMSKRTGRSITLEDLVEEAGRDAVRFFFNTKTSGSHLDFDLDLAVKQSNDNPVFYVQYAHARICSILRILEDEGVTVPGLEEVNLKVLDKQEEIELIKKLAEMTNEVELAAKSLEPSRLTRYVTDVASLFHSFYNGCRVKGEEEDIMKARLFLVDCTKTVIKNVLKLLSINAPERM